VSPMLPVGRCMEFYRGFLTKDPKKIPVLLPTAFWIVCGLKDETPLTSQETSAVLRALELCWKGDGWASATDRLATVSLLATFSAIQILTLLKHPIPNRERIIGRIVRHLSPDGEVTNHIGFGSPDIRFLYCLVGSLHLLSHSCSPAQTASLAKFISACQAPEGGFGCEPRAEAHAGHTFCAVASLGLLGLPRGARVAEWLGRRLEPSGRPGKRLDVCYAWWVGASLVSLGEALPGELRGVIASCKVEGGYSPRPGGEPDLFHTFFATLALGLFDGSIDPNLAMPRYIVFYFYFWDDVQDIGCLSFYCCFNSV